MIQLWTDSSKRPSHGIVIRAIRLVERSVAVTVTSNIKSDDRTTDLPSVPWRASARRQPVALIEGWSL